MLVRIPINESDWGDKLHHSQMCPVGEINYFFFGQKIDYCCQHKRQMCLLCLCQLQQVFDMNGKAKLNNNDSKDGYLTPVQKPKR